MNEVIKIENKEIKKIDYKGIPVITAKMIAELHGKEVLRVNEQFRRNQEKLIENEDYILLNKYEIAESDLKDYLFPKGSNSITMPAFTETGYLMLVKTFENEMSWKIQRILVKSYFKVKAITENDIDNIISKKYRKSFTSSIKDSPILTDTEKIWAYKNFTDLGYKKTLGLNAKQYREANGLEPTATVRKYLEPEKLKKVINCEEAMRNLIEMGCAYGEVKDMFNLLENKTDQTHIKAVPVTRTKAKSISGKKQINKTS